MLGKSPNGVFAVRFAHPNAFVTSHTRGTLGEIPRPETSEKHQQLRRYMI